MNRWLMVAAVLVCQGGICGGGGPPSNDQCGGPMLRGPIDAVEVGTLPVGSGDPAEFTALAEGGSLTLIHGPQGGVMVALALRVNGSDPPECLGQKTQISYQAGGAALQDSVTVPLATYATGPGVRTTHTNYLIFDAFPDAGPVVLTVEAGGKTITRHISLLR